MNLLYYNNKVGNIAMFLLAVRKITTQPEVHKEV